MRRRRHFRAALVAFLLLAAAALGWHLSRPAPTAPGEPWRVRAALPEDTTVEGLRDRLAVRGLPLRLVPAESTRGPARVAWRTETGAGRAELGRLTCDERNVGAWRGTVQVRREADRTDAEDRASGCWLVAPPFALFGDPALLASPTAEAPVPTR
jgi:hypothetical protein